MAILVAEWRGVLGRSWNSERPLVFDHIFLTKSSGVCRAKDIQARINRRMELWERGIHAGLMGDSEAEGAAREDRARQCRGGGGQGLVNKLPRNCALW